MHEVVGDKLRLSKLRRARLRRATWASLALLSLILLLATVAASQTVRVDITPGHVANSFVPTEALGAGIDRIDASSTDKVFTEPVMKQVLAAGWHSVTYRQNTELHVEAWHWNPQGTWSESGKKDISWEMPGRLNSFVTRSAIPCLIEASPATKAQTPRASLE